MNAGRVRNPGAANRSLLLVVPLSALLLMSIGLNVRHYYLEHERRARALTLERVSQAAVALAKEEAERTKLKKQSRDAESNARIRQLYEEINHLSRVGEGVLLPVEKVRGVPAETVGQEKTALIP